MYKKLNRVCYKVRAIKFKKIKVVNVNLEDFCREETEHENAQ